MSVSMQWGNNQVNQGFSQQNQYPNQFNQYNQYNQYNQGFGQNAKQPPIPFQAGNYASKWDKYQGYYPKAHALVTTQRKKVQELKLKH